MIAWRLFVACLLLLTTVAESAVYITPPGVTCTNDTRLTAPVTGQDFCFDAASNTLNNWNGSAWVTISIGNSQASTNVRTGLTVSNNGADAVNDLDIAVGLADSDDAVIANRQQMSLVSALTKQLDVAWAVGTNQGMRSGAALANGTWHIFLIKRTDTGVVDIFADTSLTPTLPTNYTKKRRIASVLREGATLIPFVQDGYYFRRKASILDVNTTNPGTGAVTATLSVPVGPVVYAQFNTQIVTNGAAIYTVFSDLAANDEAPSVTVAPLGMLGIQLTAGAIADQGSGTHVIRTNTLAQIRYRLTASAAATVVRIATLGWYDPLGTN